MPRAKNILRPAGRWRRTLRGGTRCSVEVFVLENERQIEEVEQEERHHVQMASFTADEVRGKGDRSRRDTDEHDEDRVEVEGDLQGLVPLAFPFAGRRSSCGHSTSWV